LLGGTYWGWLYVSILWIDEKYRKNGIGSKLLKDAETEALRRGCEYAHLDTMSFQALGFYKKKKYRVKTVIKKYSQRT
jgi:GNAT superfamily N-acetyltransferase